MTSCSRDQTRNARMAHRKAGLWRDSAKSGRRSAVHLELSGVEIVIPPPVGAKSLCPTCGTTCKKGSQLKYVGLIFHDLRRSGVRNLRRLGVQESIAMRISGHKTRAVFERYNIVDESDLANAASRLDAKRNAAAVEVNRDFGHDRGELHQNRGRCADAACNCCSA